MTEQQVNQIRAALLFWAAVARTSRVHPSEHPVCRHLFETHMPLPAESVELLASYPFVEQQTDALMPIREAIRGTEISPARVRYFLRKHTSLTPTMIGGTGFYPAKDLQAAVALIRAKEEVFKRRDKLDEIVDPETSEAESD